MAMMMMPRLLLPLPHGWTRTVYRCWSPLAASSCLTPTSGTHLAATDPTNLVACCTSSTAFNLSQLRGQLSALMARPTQLDQRPASHWNQPHPSLRLILPAAHAVMPLVRYWHSNGIRSPSQFRVPSLRLDVAPPPQQESQGARSHGDSPDRPWHDPAGSSDV